MAKISNPSLPSVNDEQVEEYLRHHPRFLVDRPDLLAELNIPHGAPDGVASLIERQVTRLRNENVRLQKQLAITIDELDSQQALTQQVLETSLELLETGKPETLYNRLRDFMGRHYDADYISLSLFMDREVSIDSTIAAVFGRNDKLRVLLAELFNRQQPLFDSLQHEHLVLLFGEVAGNVQSTALLPLSGKDWDGLFALGSRSRDRYHRGRAFDLLFYLTRITALRIDSWVREQAT